MPDMRLSFAQEAMSNEIDLSADELPVVWSMVRYLYHIDYPDAEPLDGPALSDQIPVSATTSLPITESHLLFHVEMHIIADKYDIAGLKQIAVWKARADVRNRWDIEKFSAAAKFLWDNTMKCDREIKGSFTEVARKHIEMLIVREDFMDLVTAEGSLGLDMLTLMARDDGTKKGSNF